MKTITQFLGALLFFALVSCSEPPRFFLFNNSGHEVVVEILGQPKATVASGQWVELKFDPALGLLWDGKSHGYSWRYPLPVAEFMEYGKPAGRFAVSLEADGAIYARKVVNSKPSVTLPAQPTGFPLVSH